MPLFYVKIRKNIDICNYLPIYYPAICRGWGTFSVPSQREGVPPNRLKHSKNGLPPLGEGRGGASTISYFSTGESRTFFTAKGRFFYRGGCWRHAVHDGGDGPNDKEENLFSDRHWRQRRQGEAASSDHGFLYSFNPHYRVSR